MFKKALVGVRPLSGRGIAAVLPAGSRPLGDRIRGSVIRIGYAQGAGYAHEDDYQAWLENDATPIRAAGLTVATSVIASGVPADGLLAEAAAQDADLIVVGSRNHNFLYEISGRPEPC